jgi:periplasmic protein CpxP/Spy
MKKYVAMIALALAFAGTASAQNAPQRENQDNQENQYGRERGERKQKGEFRRNAERRDNISPEQRATRRTEKLSQQLDLSSKQKKQLQALNLKQAQQMESLRGQNNQPGERNGNRREEMKNLHASYEKELKGILSKKQYAKYQENQKQMQAQRENRSGRDGDNNRRFRRPNNG